LTKPMIPIGYMFKKVAKTPKWLKVEDVIDVYSVSGCISKNFADYVNYWKHNGYWLFDSPEIMESLAKKENIDLLGSTLFYYEAYQYEFNDLSNEWLTFGAEKSFVTSVEIPTNKNLQGFDVVSFWASTSPECSPLSCNLLAAEIPVNKHCLFNTFEEAQESIERGLFENSEPGPYRIFAVYTLDDGLTRNRST
jgi:hypothetical protein